jgi:hypothetical protein
MLAAGTLVAGAGTGPTAAEPRHSLVLAPEGTAAIFLMPLCNLLPLSNVY